MAVNYNKTKSEPYKAATLQKEINMSSLIVPSCLSITGSGTSLTIEMASSLSGAEETELDSIIAAHVKPVDTVDVLELPYSDVDDTGTAKLAVHPSYKPKIDNGETFAVWAGVGDDVDSDPPVLGGGDLLHFVMTTGEGGSQVITKDVKFDHAAFGRVWIHEAYLKFFDAGEGDYVSSDIMATGVVLQQVQDLDLETYVLDGKTYVKYAAGGAGTGTHGFASTPTLITRSFSKDGDWDWTAETGAVPNMSQTGEYRICTEDMPVHRYVNKIPLYKESHYFSMSSDETAEIWPGYYIRINVHNVSDSNWHLSVIMELYRERTVDP